MKGAGIMGGRVMRNRWLASTFTVLLALVVVRDARGQEVMPCTIATSACTEWIGLGNEPQRVLVYRSYPLEAANRGIVRALILIHGGGRNATDLFNTALAAAFLTGTLNDTVLIVLRFASNAGTTCRDTLATREANWGCEDGQADSWRNGSTAINNDKLTSYDFVDEVLRKLARKEGFPSLRGVVIAGHSGGGQFALRYAMASEVPDKLGLPTTYVVANPDALIYFDGLRPTAAAYALPPPADPFVPFADVRNCATFDNWPYGLQSRSGYTARVTNEQLKQQLSGRAVTYLLGGLDLFPIAGFDGSCPAMAQGPTRFARGIAFGKYVNEKYGAHHKTEVVLTCGHDERCLFVSNAVLPLLFPKQE
jgi:pimeloyl-ACP methyl ester carboxylesterase